MQNSDDRIVVTLNSEAGCYDMLHYSTHASQSDKVNSKLLSVASVLL